MATLQELRKAALRAHRKFFAASDAWVIANARLHVERARAHKAIGVYSAAQRKDARANAQKN